jgi:multidrug efflux pump subunit AcrA (membrane-fusion protein)
MKKIMAAIMAMLTAAGFIFGPSLLARLNTSSAASVPGEAGGSEAGSGGTNTVFTVRIEDAQIRSLQVYIEVNGNIKNKEQVTVVPEAAGKLVSMEPAIGAMVHKGDLLAQVDPSRPGMQYLPSPVYAPVSGMVVSNPVSVGSTVSTVTPLLTIAPAGPIEIEALIPEREIGQLRVGLSAELRLEAFPGEVFLARVVRLSPVVDPASRTKSITLHLINEDTRVNPGMFARLKINTRTYENVISIPQDAVVQIRGSTAVFVLSDAADEVRIREVSLGVSVDGEAEIKSGLSAGDKVVVQGQQFLTDGAAIRVLGGRS